MKNYSIWPTVQWSAGELGEFAAIRVTQGSARPRVLLHGPPHKRPISPTGSLSPSLDLPSQYFSGDPQALI